MAEVLTQKELHELMIQRGLEFLEERQRFVSFDGQIISGNMSYEYKKDFFKGDLVTVYSRQLDRYVNLQITAVTKSISNGVEYFDITFGYDRVTIGKLFDKPRVYADSVASESNGSGNGGG